MAGGGPRGTITWGGSSGAAGISRALRPAPDSAPGPAAASAASASSSASSAASSAAASTFSAPGNEPLSGVRVHGKVQTYALAFTACDDLTVRGLHFFGR